jgi:orotidine-5'-phosphate decarboxylase
MSDPRIIVALDFPAPELATSFAARLNPSMCKVKIGKELFTASGPRLVESLVDKGFDVFLDLKFHDIPNTVANACKAAARLRVWMINVHALGGRKMLAAAREAVPAGSTRLIAVTLLTSMGRTDLSDVGLSGEPQDVVERLALLARDCGLDGVVCSALEAAELRNVVGNDFCLVTPGIRPTGTSPDEQRRITTPSQAIRSGASYLVIGRPITQASDPVLVLQQLNDEIASLLRSGTPKIDL